jgi:regulator of protease activity HflC (stomatin/prohibitin superfamily)
MSAVAEETAVATSKFPPVVYDITAERIAELREMEKTLDPSLSTKAYEESCKFRQTCVKTRTGMDAKRKELKADSLEWGRLVDSTYKTWEKPLLEVESAIDAKIKAVDTAKENARKAKEAAERAAIEAELEAQRAAAAAALKAEQDRIAEANRVEAERLAVIAAEQAAAQKKIDDANAILAAEAQRIADATAELEARRLEAEKAAAPPEPPAPIAPPVVVTPAPAPAPKKVSAKATDTAAINALAFALCTIALPTVNTPKATEFVLQLNRDLTAMVERCREFKA